MRDQEIFLKAIRKALSNGWEAEWAKSIIHITKAKNDDSHKFFSDDAYFLERKNKPRILSSAVPIIFSHDFAKAFWPGKQYCYSCDSLVMEGYDYCRMHDEK